MKLLPPMERRYPEDDHWWFASRTRALLGLLDDALRRDGGSPPAPAGAYRVLDVGCGAGNMIHHLSRYGAVTGLDNYARPLAVCRARGHAATLAPAEAMPFADASFDLVAALDTIEHCEDDRPVLAECYRVLKPGGLLAVTVPAFRWLWTHNDDLNGHKRRYTAAELRDKLAAQGFGVQRLSYSYFFVFPLAAGLLLLRRRRGEKLTLAAPTTDEEAYQVEMEPASPPVNALLGAVGALEAAIVRRVSLPIGTSVICIAQKPAFA